MSFVTEPTGDPFSQLIDPEHAANQLAALLNVLGEEGGGTAAETGNLSQPAVEQALTTPATPTTVDTSSKGTVNPIPGGNYQVSGEYGEQRGKRQHGGIDMAVPVGTTVVAAISGTVTKAGNDDPGGYGNMVEITGPNGMKTRYAHMSHFSPKVGQQVKAGQPIGKSGGAKGSPGAGNSQGPHLHFEVHGPNGSMDPAPYLAGGAQVLGDIPDLDSPEAPAFNPEEQAGAAIANAAQMVAGQEPTHGVQPVETTTGSPQGADPSTQDGFFAGVLAGIGAPVTPANMQFLRAFARAEGGSPDNPFNTSQKAAGSSTFNTHGVQRYGDPAVGMQATIKTLTNGMYQNIIAALKRGTDPFAAAQALSGSPWDADGKVGGLVMQILRGG